MFFLISFIQVGIKSHDHLPCLIVIYAAIFHCDLCPCHLLLSFAIVTISLRAKSRLGAPRKVQLNSKPKKRPNTHPHSLLLAIFKNVSPTHHLPSVGITPNHRRSSCQSLLDLFFSLSSIPVIILKVRH